MTDVANINNQLYCIQNTGNICPFAQENPDTGAIIYCNKFNIRIDTDHRCTDCLTKYPHGLRITTEALLAPEEQDRLDHPSLKFGGNA